MDHPVTEEESYANRRQLFKNIWDTAINIKTDDEKKERNFVNKPRVIKTLRLDEVNRCTVGKKKKQRLKHLRLVCNKLLDFCDRQEADDMFYGQMTSKRMTKKSKVRRVKKAKRRFSHTTQKASQSGITSPAISSKLNKSSRNSSPMNTKKTSLSGQDNSCKRHKRKRVQKFLGTEILIRPSNKYSNKRLFPINKIYID